MALWFFAAIFGVIFATFYFVYDSDRLAGGRDASVAAAEIFSLCHEAAVLEARSNTLLGAGAAATRNCTDTGANALTVPTITGVNVSGIAITINPATDVGLATGRVIVTYLTSGNSMNGIPYQTVRSQLGQRYAGNSTVGEVQQVGGFNVINSVVGVQARVPTIVPINALAMVTTVQP